MPKNLIVFGDRTASEMEAVAREVYSDHFVQILKCYVNPENLSLDPNVSMPCNQTSTIYYAIGVLDLKLKLRIEAMCCSLGYRPWSLVHPSAYVPSSVKLGAGCFIAPHAAIGIDAEIGDHSIVHFHASVGHGAKIGRHCAILPGARLSGHVELGDGVLVGSNAFIYQGTKVGEQAQIDALTYVRENVAPRRVLSVRRENPNNH